ncbi:MAG: hypothetical protein QOG80_3255 [Pseudonocardiales bacterium]|nr:hypothetical protein [Pseudonocardiales bacterium]
MTTTDPGQGAARSTRALTAAGRWITGHRRISTALVVAVVVALAALADWPHRATSGQLRADLESYVSQVRDDVLSCGTEVEDSLSAYNQILAGASTKRSVAEGIMSNAAVDCTPSGNAMILDLAALQPPRSLAKFDLDVGARELYAWASADGVDAVQDLHSLMVTPGDPVILGKVRALLADMQQRAGASQAIFDRAAKAVGATAIPLGLDEVQPGVLVG